MASNYPGSLDSFDTIASDKKTSDSVGGRTHRQMHNDLGDAIESVQTELGTTPSGSYDTVKARLDALVAYAAKTGAYTATIADHTLNVTSGTFTLDLPAASTCAGQSLRVKNSSSGVVTLDGNSSETVEGVATFPLGPRSYVEITSTGSAWILTGGVPDTGWRLDASGLTANWTGSVWVRRVGRMATVSVSVAASGTGGSYTTISTVPAFMVSYQPIVYGMARNATADKALPIRFDLDSSSIVLAAPVANADAIVGSIVYPVDTAWPASLPGSAV